MSQPDLFVVCKNCGSEVSPYVTECPYCGQRVRKRAPKIERGAPAEPKVKRRRAPSLGRLRRDEIPGIAPETRPYATWTLAIVSLLASVVLATDEFTYDELGAINGDIGDEWWRVVTTPFLYDNLGYQFIALAAIAIFGMHLERRFGATAIVAVFFLSAAGGAALSVLAGFEDVLGGNAAALGLLFAWLVNDRLAFRRGDDRESDLLGVYVICGLLFALSLAEDDASIVAGVAGAAIGALSGLILTAVRR